MNTGQHVHNSTEVIFVRDVVFYLLLFLLGGAGYFLIECLWRGRSHWSMALTGGIALVILYGLFTSMPKAGLVVHALAGAVLITSLEFVCGAIVNVRLKWNVWDYSRLKYQLYGQISLRYFALWVLLCVPLSLLLMGIHTLR